MDWFGAAMRGLEAPRAGHLAVAAQLTARADAAARLVPLESGERDPGPGATPHRDRLPVSRRPPAAPHARIIAAARGGGHYLPHGTTHEDLRAVWRARRDLRPAIEALASQMTTTEKEPA